MGISKKLKMIKNNEYLIFKMQNKSNFLIISQLILFLLSLLGISPL